MPTKLSEHSASVLRALRESLPPREADALEAWALNTFYRYQVERLLDMSRFSLTNKSRQIGESHTQGGVATLWGAFLGETTTLISVGEREAFEFADKAARHAQVLVECGSQMARVVAASSQRVKLASGGRFVALPNSSGGRSYSGNVMLDEVAYWKQPEKTWDGASAVVMHGYKLRAVSTPNGTGNFWHDLWKKAPDLGYRCHETTIDDAIEDGLQVDKDDLWKMAKGDPRLFGQLFECKFLDGINQLIPFEAIEACRADSTWRDPREGDAYAGLDLGRDADRTELVIVRIGADHRAHIQQVETCKRTDSSDVDRLAHMAIVDHRCKRLVIDATGMGEFPAERLQSRYGQLKVEPFKFTLQSKEVLATTLFHAFVNGWVRIPRADQQLADEVASLRREVTAAGNVRYDAPSTADGHADRAWALALALHGTGKTYGKVEVIP